MLLTLLVLLFKDRERNAQELISEEEKEKKRLEKRRAKKKVRDRIYIVNDVEYIFVYNW